MKKNVRNFDDLKPNLKPKPSEVVEVYGSIYEVKYPTMDELNESELEIVKDRINQCDDSTVIDRVPILITKYRN